MSGSIPDGEAAARSPTLTLATRGPLFDAQAALRARLELAFPPAQVAFITIPARPTKATWDRVIAKPPFVGLCWLGLRPSPETGRLFHCASDWLVYLGCRNTTPAGLLQGDLYGVGQLGFASLGAAILHGWSAPDIGTWTVQAVDNAALQEMVNEDVGIVALQVSCTLTLIDTEAAAALPEFLRLGAVWSLPPLDDRTIDVRQAA